MNRIITAINKIFVLMIICMVITLTAEQIYASDIAEDTESAPESGQIMDDETFSDDDEYYVLTSDDLPKNAKSANKSAAVSLLKQTIENVTILVNETDIYEDGAYIPSGKKYVNQKVYDKIVKAIDSAWDQLESEDSAEKEQLDNATKALVDAYIGQNGFEAQIQTVYRMVSMSGNIISDPDTKASEDDIRLLIKTGELYINEIQFPMTEEEFARNYPAGFSVNDRYMKLGDSSDNYYTNCIALLEELPAETVYYVLYLDGGNTPDRICAFCYEPVIVAEINENEGRYSITRSTVEQNGQLVPYMGEIFSEGTEEISVSNFDPGIEKDEVALCYKNLNGWVVRRAIEVKGSLTEVQDGSLYMDGERFVYRDGCQYPDLPASNRADVMSQAMSYFEFTGDNSVSMWAVKGEDGNLMFPCAVLIDDDADSMLDRAVRIAENCIKNVTVYEEEPDDPELKGEPWVTQAEYDMLEEEIADARTVLENDDQSIRQIEYQISSLYTVIAQSTDIVAPGNYGHSDSQAASDAKEARTAGMLKSTEMVVLIIFIVIAVIVVATAVYVYINSRKKRAVTDTAAEHYNSSSSWSGAEDTSESGTEGATEHEEEINHEDTQNM